MIPSTQAVAWSEVLKRLPKSEQIVADYVKFNPGQDRNEIDRGLSDRPNAGHSRRLARLERKGVLRRGPAHISSVTGHLCDTWFATGDPPRWVPIPVPAHKRLTRLCQDLEQLLANDALFVSPSALRAALERAKEPHGPKPSRQG